MSIISVAAVAVGAVFLTMYLRTQQKEIAALLSICTAVILFGASISKTAEAMTGILATVSEEGYGEQAAILVKALALAAAAQITAEICREAGEAAIGTQVELFAKIEIVLLAAPLAQRLIRTAQELLI